MTFLLALTLVAASLGSPSHDEPARQPQLAVRGSIVALSYGSGQSIYFQQSADHGRTFGAPVDGFSLNSMFQYYSSLPFNITTGATTVQGTTARPTINGVFINRNAGEGFDFLTLSARLSRSFQLSERLRMTAMAEGFNLTNHMNGVSLNGNFGAGAYPGTPSSTFKQITAVGDPRGFQFALRFVF